MEKIGEWGEDVLPSEPDILQLESNQDARRQSSEPLNPKKQAGRRAARVGHGFLCPDQVP